MSHPGAVATPTPHVAHEAHHEELGFWRKYVFSTDHKVIGIQYGITGLLFLLFGFSLMMLHALSARVPGQPVAVPRLAARRGADAGRDHAPDLLQRARGDARHHHGVPRRGAARGWRIRELRAPAPDRRPGHGVPEAQHVQLLVLLPRRRDDARQLLRPRRGRVIRMDLLLAPRQHRDRRSDVVARRDDLPDHLVAARRGQLHHHHDPAPGGGTHLLPVPLLRVGAVRDRLPPAAGLSATRGGGGHAAHGSPGRDELLPAERARRQRPAARGGRRRQRAPLAAPVLVPGAPGSLRADPSGHGHRRRDHREQHAQAAVGLSRDGLLAHLPRLHVVHRVGAPHVHDRHGDGDGDVLPDDDDDHLDPVGRDPDGAGHLAVGRIDTLQYADAVRARLPADVRHRRADRASARLEHRRHPAARHLLRHRPLPLRRRAGDDLRAVRRDLLLVPQGDRPDDERDARQDPLRRLVRLHERHLHADVPHGTGRRLAAAVRRWSELRLRAAGAAPERRLDAGAHGSSPSSRSPSSSISSGASGRGRRSATTRGRRRRSSGRRPRRRRTATSLVVAASVPGTLRVQRSRRGQGLHRRSTRPDARWTFRTQ